MGRLVSEKKTYVRHQMTIFYGYDPLNHQLVLGSMVDQEIIFILESSQKLSRVNTKTKFEILIFQEKHIDFLIHKVT